MILNEFPQNSLVIVLNEIQVWLTAYGAFIQPF